MTYFKSIIYSKAMKEQSSISVRPVYLIDNISTNEIVPIIEQSHANGDDWVF